MAGQDFGDQLPYSREVLDQMRRRAEIRKRLKNEYYHYYRNPLIASYMVDTYDPAQQRMTAALTYQPDQMNKFYKTRHTFMYLGIFLGIPFLLAGLQYRFKDKSRLEKIASGEITLKERMDARLVPGL